jgi:AraC family ethanolamine operon transcriptional activator
MTIESTSAAVPRTPPIQSMRQEFRYFDELAETVHGWGLDWVQLDRGPLDAAIQQIVTPTTLLSRFRFSRKFHQRGTSPPGVRTFGLIGDQSPEVKWRGKTGSNTHILAFPTEDVFEVVSQPGFHGDTLSIPEDRVRSVAESIGLPDPFESTPPGLAFVEIDPRRLAALREAISRLHRMAMSRVDSLPNAAVLSEMELDIVSALVAALQTTRLFETTSPEPGLRARAIRSALDYIEEKADEPPNVQEICRAAGVSWRTLNYAFRDRLGVTPKQYLQATRLHRVRHAILDAAPPRPISEIAARWGFWHMGQFAADYRRQFGELPSETLRRAKRIASTVAVPG